MRIVCDNPSTKAIKIGRLNAWARFSKNGFATVSDEVGRFLVRKYSVISEVVAKKPVVAKKRKVADQVGDSDGRS